MLIGAVVLLAAAILDAALDDDFPRWLYVGMFGIGYVLLAYGFFSALNARRGGPTPRDRG